MGRPNFFILTLTLGIASASFGQGILLPTDEKLPAVPVVYQRVHVVIKEQAAQTRIEQEFRNTASQPVEAIYLFPVPSGASVNDFAMWIDGKRTKAELTEATQARQIYTDIVRRLRDPGLLERMNDQLFRVRVFPIPAQGTQRIELVYSQVVPREAGLAEFLYPKSQGPIAGNLTEKDFTLRVELESKAAIKNIYSPTHSVGITREGDHRAIVGFEENHSTLAKDFRLLWSAGLGDVGIASVPFRETRDQEGYLLLLLSPSESLAQQQRVPRDIVFVIDTSGSMAGEKMNQAKSALKHAVARLAQGDRFGLVRFATTAEPWERNLIVATEDKKKLASDWIDKLEATGGTAITAALELANLFRATDGRPLTIAFLTDGQPTVGVTDPKAILAAVLPKEDNQTRLFAFGIGDDVNAPLLDQLSEATRGSTTYVRPSENIEIKVSSYFDKISHPVLANLKLSLANNDIVLKETFPPKLPDLFHGNQLVVLARYAGSGATSVRLEGTIGNEQKSMEQEIHLLADPGGPDFVASLWAQRKVGYLLDQIRLHGENKELVDEVIAIAKKFGIVTPYTSYLLAPNVPTPALTNAEPPLAPRWTQGYFPNQPAGSEPIIAQAEVPVDRKSLRMLIEGNQITKSRDVATLRSEESGAVAVDVAQAIEAMKSAQQAAQRTERIAGRVFHLFGHTWIEADLDDTQEIIRVEYLSEAYFELASVSEPLRRILALGPRIIFRGSAGQPVSIEAQGKATLSPEDRQRILGK
jgi:Ca-activated chloride channel family protein